jgi:hypothetical protein
MDQHYFSFEKCSGTQRVTQNLFGEGGVSYTNVRKKGSRMLFRPSQKELPECRSGTLHHKNYH